MKKFLLTSILIVISSFWLSANAQVIETSQFAKIVEAQQIKDLQELGYNDVQVKVLSIPIQRVEVPDGKVSIKINSREEINSREYKKVDIYIDSKYNCSIGIPLEIYIYENILVAKNTITRDTVISSQNAEFKRYNVAGLIQKPLTKDDLNTEMIATKFYRPGDVIDKKFSKTKPDVIRNAIVTVIFKTDNDLSISVEGKSLSEGSIGSFVNVENKTYKKVYIGRVIGPNKVLVEI